MPTLPCLQKPKILEQINESSIVCVNNAGTQVHKHNACQTFYFGRM